MKLDKLLTLIGRYFQIRDDYQNLQSAEVSNRYNEENTEPKQYASAKGSLSDLDEGKYSFMLIHALEHTSSNRLQSVLQMRSRNGYLSMEVKNVVMDILASTKSLEYTHKYLCSLADEIHSRLEVIEEEVGQKNWLLRAIMAKLRLADVTPTRYRNLMA